jgi:hypothetical protein
LVRQVGNIDLVAFAESEVGDGVGCAVGGGGFKQEGVNAVLTVAL